LLWGILTKRWRDAFRCLHPIAIVAFCATAPPWYILCAHRNPDFLRVFIIEHNFRRYLTPEFQHIQPFWFYIPVFLVAIFPWIVLTVPAARSIYNQFRERSSQPAFELLLFSWLVFVLLFFSLSHSKLPGYILPAVPPAALLLSEQLCKLLEETRKRLRWITMAFGICLAIFGGIFVFASMRLPAYTDVRPSPLAEQIALIAVLGGIGIVLLGFFRHYRPSLFITVILLLILVVRIDTFVGKINPGLTARSTFTEADKLWPGFTVSEASTWQLNRSLLFQLNFYSHTELPEWQAGQPKPEWLFVKPKREAEARNLGFICRNYLFSPAVILCRNPD
jgi:4-amino-4-deoxy-L-arabinose transferase-like glycosyltransferase